MYFVNIANFILSLYILFLFHAENWAGNQLLNHQKIPLLFVGGHIHDSTTDVRFMYFIPLRSLFAHCSFCWSYQLSYLSHFAGSPECKNACY